jgi:hypothetical protein
MLGNVIVEEKMNFYTLLDEADILLFSGSTIQFDALFYEKPIILASNSQLAGKGIAYEVASKDLIAQTIEDAFLKKEFEVRKANAVQFVSWMLDNYLIKVSNNSPANNSFREFANFIHQASIKYEQNSIDGRIKLFNESIKAISKHKNNFS